MLGSFPSLKKYSKPCYGLTDKRYYFYLLKKTYSIIKQDFNNKKINDRNLLIFENNLSFETGSNGVRKEQGTNQTIFIRDLYRFEKEHAQAPIIPNSTGSNQLKRISDTSLGNIQKGRISRRYYRSLAVGNQNNILLT